MAGLGYRSEIDGLRAVAVLAVILFHLDLGVPGGYVGVDVFFVISGFLITRIIRRGLERDTFSISDFWERRVRRIFPAMFVVVAASIAVGYGLLLPDELVSLGESSLAQTLLMANVYFWRDAGYFSGPAELKPLLHTWSLAVEEQFYLFFPMVLCWTKRLSRKRLGLLLTTAAIISLGISVSGVHYYAVATFYLLPTRAWELLVGCILAVVSRESTSRPRLDNVMAMLGMGGILVPMLVYRDTTPFPGLAALPPVIGTALVIQATGHSRDTWLGRTLSFRPLVQTGLISYSLYLWHWPVLVYSKLYFGDLTWSVKFFVIAISVLLATLSWHFVERPYRVTNRVRKPRYVFATALSLTAMTILTSVILMATHGAAWRFPDYLPANAVDATWKGREYVARVSTDRRMELSDLRTLGIDPQPDRQRPDFVVWGDSHGMALAEAIDQAASENHLYGKAILDSGFAPLPFLCRSDRDQQSQVLLRQRIMEFLGDHPPRNLVLICRWSLYAGDPVPGETPFQLLDSRPEYSHLQDRVEILGQNLVDLEKFCSNRDIQLWVVKQVPETAEPAPARDLLRFRNGLSSVLPNRRHSVADHQRQQANVELVFGALGPDCSRWIDPAPSLFDADGMTINYSDGRSLYRDEDHLSRSGAQRIKPVLAEMLLEMKSNRPADPGDRYARQID